MKTIGLIGGIGPQATMDFERRLHETAQQVLTQRFNTGYPPLLVYYLREPPIAVDDRGTPLLPPRPSPRLLEAAAIVGASSDFIVVTANAPHNFKEQIEEAAGKPLLSMVRLAVAEVRARGWKRCGLIEMGQPNVYPELLSELGIAWETLPGPLRERVDRAVLALMEGRADASSASAVGEAVYELVGRGVDGVLLGCTELPLLLGPAADALSFINPAQLLAEAALRRALAG